MIKKFSLVCALIYTPSLFASDKVTSPTEQLVSMLFGLIMVVGLIFALAFIVKRLNLGQMASGPIKTLAIANLGQKEKVAVIEVANKQYLIGVTAGQINLIDTLEEPLAVNKPDFASILKKQKK
ncbi:flagellar biosynthetic protein FliO [Paraferrimonas sp. SM1919]|uniref:flagellar biosynthetic protein FliO n=1 Tax=Paraferrimonas sp. SM1919 TaxID=2662263 RepID=UPI0013D45613|nr:flagellar biosynthetic protein FliO [Paraferrimonas sp. SM1919]